MRNQASCCHRVGCHVLALALCIALPAQAERAFLEAHAQFVAADAAVRPALAALASDRFLAIADPDARTRCLLDGLRATLESGRLALALDLAREARAAGRSEPPLVAIQLTALLRSGRFPQFVDQARADRACLPEVVQQVLAAEESTALPLAEKALRTGDSERGRFVFAELAAIEPAQAYRLGNFALCLRQLGEIDAARSVYERARRAAPEDLDLENDYGLFLRANGDVAGAAAAFQRAWQLDLGRSADLRARGPAVTNLVHLEATRPGSAGQDPLPAANLALAVRADATMLKRLVLDVALDRLTAARGRR